MSKSLEKTKIELKNIDGSVLTVDVVPYISAQKRAELNRIPVDFYTDTTKEINEISVEISKIATDIITKKEAISSNSGEDAAEILAEINDFAAKQNELEAKHEWYRIYSNVFGTRLNEEGIDIGKDTTSADMATAAKIQREVIEDLFYDDLNIRYIRAVIKQDNLDDATKELINSDYRSEFWQKQDFMALGETADYFRWFIKPRR